MKKYFEHLRRYIFRGIIALIPAAITIFIVILLYNVIDKRVVGFIDQYFGIKLPGLGFFILLAALYLIGLITSNVIGRTILSILDKIFAKIPIVKFTYQIGKQVSNALSISEKQVFKKAVLVEYFKADAWVVGFVIGKIKNSKTDEELLKVFVPTVPNPTSGFMVMLKESDTIDPHWSIEEAMKIVISGGLIGPETINDTKDLT